MADPDFQSYINQARRAGAETQRQFAGNASMRVPRDPVETIEPPLPVDRPQSDQEWLDEHGPALIRQSQQEQQQQQPQPSLQKQPRTVGEYLSSIQNEGDRYEEKRKFYGDYKRRLKQEAFNLAEQQFNPGSTEQKNYLDLQLKKIDEAIPDIKPIQESEMFKSAKSYVDGSYRQTLFALGNLHNQLLIAKGIKDKEEKTRFLEANIPKVINSMATGSSDALQEAERFFVTPEFKTIFTAGQPWDLQKKLEIINQRGLWSSLFKDPEGFIKKAEDIYLSASSKSNSTYDYFYPALGKATDDTGLMKLRPINSKSLQMDLQGVRAAIKQATGQDPEETMKKFNPLVPMKGTQQTPMPSEIPKSRFGVTRPTGVSIVPAPASIPEDFTGKSSY